MEDKERIDRFGNVIVPRLKRLGYSDKKTRTAHKVSYIDNIKSRISDSQGENVKCSSHNSTKGTMFLYVLPTSES